MVTERTSGNGGLSGFVDVRRLIVQVFTGRWFMFFASLVIMSVEGTVFIFGLYSRDIKSTLGYDQSTLNLLSFSKDVGGNFGIIAGLINEVTPPWVVLSIGAALNFFGYFMVWLAVTQRISRPAVWHMCLYIGMAGNSHAFANVGALITSVKNFPESRGAVLGVLKGYIGLSGAIITQLYYALYYNDTKALILLLAWLPLAVNLVLLPAIRIMKVIRQPKEIKVFYNFLYLSLGLAAFLMIMIIMQKQFTFTRAKYGVSAVVVVFLLFLPIVIAIIEEYKLFMANKSAAAAIINDPNSPLTITTQKLDEPAEPSSGSTSTEPKLETSESSQQPSCWKTAFHQPNRGEDYTILQALFNMDMLIVFLFTVCAIGGGSTTIDNLGQIGESLGYPKKSISTFISLVSIWNYLGRVVAGFGSEFFLKKYKFPRPFLVTLTNLFSVIGYVLIAFNFPGGVYIASIITGFCLGAQWPLLFAIISEIFGLRYYSTLYNIGAAASPVGLYILNFWVTGHFYDSEANRQLAAAGRVREPGQQLGCIGVKCFQRPFIIIIGVTLLGAVFSFILGVRTRKFYKSDIYKKFREEEEGEEASTTEAEITKLPGTENGNDPSLSKLKS